MNAMVVDFKQRFALGVDRRVIPADAWVALDQAQQLIDRANAVVAAADEEARVARTAARAEGHAEGHAEALEQFAAGIDALQRAGAALGEQMRAELVELAVAIVERIAPSLGADKLIPVLAGEAVRQLSLEPSLVVRVHPDIAEATRQRLAAEGIGLNGVPSLDVVAAPEYALFDCVIETEGGVVRAGLGEQLTRVRTILAVAQEQTPGADDRVGISAEAAAHDAD